MIRRVLVVVLLVLATALVGADPVKACSCPLPPTASELVERADVLYLADVTVDDQSDTKVAYDVTVVEPFVGSVEREREVSEERERDTSCGSLRAMEPGRYLLEEYSDRRIGTACYGPPRVDVDSDLVIEVRGIVQSRGGAPPLLVEQRRPYDPPSPVFVAVLLAATVVAAVGLMVLGARRHQASGGGLAGP